MMVKKLYIHCLENQYKFNTPKYPSKHPLGCVNPYSFNGISPLQIEQGLDIFYNDYRNKTVILNDAIYLICRSIKGASKEELEIGLKCIKSGEPSKDNENPFDGILPDPGGSNEPDRPLPQK